MIDIFKLWNTLHLEGWLEDVNLPTGWKRKYLPRSAAHYFLSPLMEVFRSKRELREFMINNNDYTNEDIENIENLPSAK